MFIYICQAILNINVKMLTSTLDCYKIREINSHFVDIFVINLKLFLTTLNNSNSNI